MKRTALLRTAAAGLMLLVGVGGLGACTGSTAKSSSAEVSVGGASSAAAGSSAAAAGSDKQAAGGTAAKAQAARAVIRTASVALTANNVDTAADHVARLAVEQGGRVDSDDRSGSGAHRKATLVLRIAPNRLETALTLVAAQGKEGNRSLAAEDVTEQTVDTAARVKALTTSVTRLRVLMASAANVRDLLSVETQLSSREAELQSLQAQQAALAGQVALASLTVHLSATTPAVVKARTGVHPTGFAAAFGSGVHAVAVGLRLLAAGLGYALPVVVPLALIVLVAWRLRRRPAAPAVTSPAAAPPEPAAEDRDRVDA